MPPRPPLPPAEPLPSLNALLAFEAAARHASFTRAAAELGVTQTAVSHQVRSLEHNLGAALFRRSPRRITLTADGQAWAAELSVVFARLRDANRRLRAPRGSAREVVSVSIIPSFGSRWLVPRLARFLDAHRDVEVRISASERLVDFGVESIDLGILGEAHQLRERTLVRERTAPSR
jgi:LysR family transcriptional regulator, glycine cleavage system transcriptional activator